MDMRISGTGNIPSGEYENVSVRGCGHLYGKVRCLSFSSSGTCRGESIECAEQFKVSGKASFTDNIKAEKIRSSGSLSCDGDMTVCKETSFHGSVKCKKSIKCGHLYLSGTLSVGGDIEAESVKSAGVLVCDGLLNAENIEIKADKVMNIGSIGGSNIIIKRKRFSLITNRRVIVSSSIEGDEISLEYVTCPQVSGRVVVIGKGCKIGLVQYSGKIENSSNSTIGKTEKM